MNAFGIRPYVPSDKPAKADPARRRYTRSPEFDRDVMARFAEMTRPAKRGKISMQHVCNIVSDATVAGEIIGDDLPPLPDLHWYGVAPLWMAA